MRRALAVALALALFAACGGGGDDGAAKSTTSTVKSNAGPFYLPSFLPVGLGVTEGTATAEGPGHDAHGIAIAKPGSEPGQFSSVILVLVGEVPRDRTLRTDEAAAARPVDVNGTQARLLESPVLGANVDWFVNGLAVALNGPPGHADRVIDVARRLRLPPATDSAAVTLPSLPDGYQVIADATFIDHSPEAGQTVTIGSDAGPAIALYVTRAPDLPLVFAASGGELLRPAKVRGKEALISIRFQPVAAGGRSTTTLVWRESPQVVIALSTSGEVDSLPPIADGMASVPEQQWRTTVPEPAQS